MLKQLSFKVKHRCFEAGETFDFRPGVNLLVGDQGSGKSTVLGLFRELAKGETSQTKALETIDYKSDPIVISAFDFEKDNPRIKGHFDDRMDMGFQVQARFASHGQVHLAVIDAMDTVKTPTCFLMDEPDVSLSPRSAYDLVRTMNKVVGMGCQVLASVHSPIVIASFPEVLSLEHRRWMPSDEFMESQKKPRKKRPEKKT